MAVIRWKRKNVLIFCFSLFTLFLFTYKGDTPFMTSFVRILFGDDTGQPCNRDLIWSTPAPTYASVKQSRAREAANKAPRTVIALLGVSGSGVQWLRYLIEQMTGVYTGSTDYEFPEYFTAEGKTSDVVVVTTSDPDKLPAYSAAIILYRNLKDTVRTNFADKQGKGVFLEAPLSSYYGGKSWPDFALQAGGEWIKAYSNFLNVGVPLLIVGYEELEDIAQLTTILLRISNFLHVPVRSSVIECVIDRANEYDIKPRTLKAGFQPFSLMEPKDVFRLDLKEREVQQAINEARERYTPNVK